MDAIKEPLHHTPNFYPETYDQIGYKKLMDTLIRWEMTRSMYDDKFSGSTEQIKILSIITNSSYGMAMFHYFEGIRKGLGDPINAEYDYLKALDYFELHRDTSGILHTTMHMLRLSLNTTMIEIGHIKRYKELYEKVLIIGKSAKEPFDQIIHCRIKILYHEFMYEIKEVNFYKEYIEKGLNLVEIMPEKYDYYKYLMLNAIGIVYSKNILTIESEKFHLQAYDYLKKYASMEINYALYRIAVMKFSNKKYEEVKTFRDQINLESNNKRLVYNDEFKALHRRLGTQLYLAKGQLELGKIAYDNENLVFVDQFFKNRHLLYMKDMAALYKLEENNRVIIEKEKQEFWQRLIIISSLMLLLVLFVYIYLRSQKQKKLEKEVKQKNFIYSMIGHDLSSPMIDMDMILDHIHTDLKDKLNDKQKNYLNQLRSKAQGANLLLKNLLNLYKQGTGFSNPKHHYPPINIKNEINTSIKHLFNDKFRNIVKIENRCPEHIVNPIDSPSFQCVIRNIIDNAIKHASCTTITVNARIENKKLIVTIHDDGVGMDPTFVQSFNQSNSIYDLNNSEVKIGLGTIFILEFAKSMNSTIKISSDSEGSTYFWEIKN